MNPLIRKLLFFFFVAGFIIGAPLIVLYTAGFRYNWQSGTIIRTGVLSISTAPRSAQVLLDNLDIKRQTPAVIKQLMPGTYDLTLTKDGYHPWHNTVTIASGITTHLPLVTLWRAESIVPIWERSVVNLTASPDGNVAAYFIEQGGWNELWLDDLISGEQKMIARTAGSNKDLAISWTTQSGNLLLENKKLKTLAIYDQSGINLETSVLTAVDYLNEQNLTLNNGDKISLFETAGQTELRQTSGDTIKIIALLPKSQYSVVERDGSYLILHNAQNELLIIDLNSNEPILFKQTVKLYDYLASSHLLLWSDGNEIDIYNPTNHQTEFITRQGSPITALQFLPDGNNILIAIENKLLAIDRYKNGEQRYVATLTETDELQNFWLSSDGKTVYINGQIENKIGLFSLRLR